MRIALPTDDGMSVSPHFGRSAGFLVFDIEDGQIQKRATIKNPSCHSHDEGACGHGSGGSESSHNHGGILTALAGCNVVICAGMGGRAAEALKSAGVAEIVVTAPGLAEEVVGAFLAGKLAASNQGFCRCSH